LFADGKFELLLVEGAFCPLSVLGFWVHPEVRITARNMIAKRVFFMGVSPFAGRYEGRRARRGLMPYVIIVNFPNSQATGKRLSWP
jgi:hypothetical protein